MALVVSDRLPALGRTSINLARMGLPSFEAESFSVTLKSTGKGNYFKALFLEYGHRTRHVHGRGDQQDLADLLFIQNFFSIDGIFVGVFGFVFQPQGVFGNAQLDQDGSHIVGWRGAAAAHPFDLAAAQQDVLDFALFVHLRCVKDAVAGAV